MSGVGAPNGENKKKKKNWARRFVVYGDRVWSIRLLGGLGHESAQKK